MTACIACGSGLAREGAGSVARDVECKVLFASKPAPTGGLQGLWIGAGSSHR
ncbi:UNVERIFIED_ORG: hypothetical protein J2Y84_002559 [Pseudomonas reinekei]